MQATKPRPLTDKMIEVLAYALSRPGLMTFADVRANTSVRSERGVAYICRALHRRGPEYYPAVRRIVDRNGVIQCED